MFEVDLLSRAGWLAAACGAKGVQVTAAESCTGGLVAALLTELPGSSAMFDRGFVTYSNEAKQAMLGVADAILRHHGAVSEPCARAMAEGAIMNSTASIAVSITGIAGPGGGSDAKPIGLVHFACHSRGGGTIHVERRFGALERRDIRRAAVIQALDLLDNAVAAWA